MTSSSLPDGVTVLLPVHGAAPFLNRAIESVLRQQFDGSWELLVVFDRPDRAVRQVVAGLESSRIRTVENGSIGLVAALNTGVRAARYAFIARMDADDEMLPERLALQYEFLKNHASIGTVGGALEYIDETGRSLGYRLYPTDPRWINVLLRHRNQLAHPAVMMRTGLVRSLGGYDVAFNGAEDYDLWLRMCAHTKLANLSTVVLRYRIHGGQVTRAKRLMVAEATFLAQRAYRGRRRGAVEPPLWNVGQNPTSPWRRLVRSRVRGFAMCIDRYAEAMASRRILKGLGWALAAAALRPIEALLLRVESSRFGGTRG